MGGLYQNVLDLAGKDPDYSHPFFLKTKEIIESGDANLIAQERVIFSFIFKIPLKLLRLHEYTQEGFVLYDYPNSVGEAEL
jgi:hypothetical protein